ncbi:MAG: D-alanyl-D-alanine carboxypeptidase [Syntrophomonadaceae bacterium]|nr:D-alanyl-D-alanine carboxypeptidase [Syntrophomonadaceae bacterium]
MKLTKCISLLIISVFILMLANPETVRADTLELKAESYVLMDPDSGEVLLAKNEHVRLAPASMTKLMTLILAVEALEEGKVGLKDTVVTSENAWKMGGSQIYLEPGEEMTYEDMLIAIAVGSANDACVAVAEHLEGTHKGFVDKMNERARQLGLKNTNFVNSNGLPAENHYTSAYDMCVIAREALKHPKVVEYTSIKEYNLRQGEFVLFNTNKLLWWYQGADGFKTGWTNEAKYCLVSSAKRDGLRLVATVMATPEANGHFRDSMQLLNYGFAQYSYKTFFTQGNVCGIVQVGKGTVDSVDVVAEENVGSISIKGEESKLAIEKNLPEYVNAPIKEGQKLGEIIVTREGKEIKRVNLIAANAVPCGGLVRQIMKMIAETYLL